MVDAESFWDILINEMAVELLCTTQDCTLGPGGTVFKTPALEFDGALRYLDRHLLSHGVQCAGGGVAAAEGEGEVLARPSISRGISQREFEDFKMAWTNCVKASNKEPDVILWNCLDDEIKEMLAHNLSSIMDTITVDDMLEEIEFIAVYETPNQVGVDDDKSTVTWGKQLMLDRDKLLKELAA